MTTLGDKQAISVDLTESGKSLGTFEGHAAVLTTINADLAKRLSIGSEPVTALFAIGRNTGKNTDELSTYTSQRKGSIEIVGTVYCFSKAGIIKLDRFPSGYENGNDLRQSVEKTRTDRMARSKMRPDDYGFLHFAINEMHRRMASDWEKHNETTTI